MHGMERKRLVSDIFSVRYIPAIYISKQLFVQCKRVHNMYSHAHYFAAIDLYIFII